MLEEFPRKLQDLDVIVCFSPGIFGTLGDCGKIACWMLQKLLVGPSSSGPCLFVCLVRGFGVPRGVCCHHDYFFRTTGFRRTDG